MTFSPVSGPAIVPQCCEMVGTAQLFSMLRCWVVPISHSHLLCPSLFRSKVP